MTTTKKKVTTRKPARQVKLPPNPFQHEILELVDKQRTKAKKVEILKEYENDALKVVLIWNFDDTAISVLPKGHVPYKENEVPVGTDHTSLRRSTDNSITLKGGNDTLSSLRRETMFIQMLEGLHPKEAELICLVKDKELTTKYKLTKEIVAEAYTDIQWEVAHDGGSSGESNG